jgi:hypothetical protein
MTIMRLPTHEFMKRACMSSLEVSCIIAELFFIDDHSIQFSKRLGHISRITM